MVRYCRVQSNWNSSSSSDPKRLVFNVERDLGGDSQPVAGDLSRERPGRVDGIGQAAELRGEPCTRAGPGKVSVAHRSDPVVLGNDDRSGPGASGAAKVPGFRCSGRAATTSAIQCRQAPFTAHP
jgi:hypothetical protein